MLRESSAAVLVEFALILPVLLVMLIGAAEVSQSLIAQRKLLRATNVVGDMISREPVQSRQSINQLFAAAEAIIAPADAKKLRLKVTAIERDDSHERYMVAWSHARRQPPDRPGTVFEFEDGRQLTGQFYVVVTLESKHSGQLSQLFIGDVTFEEQFDYAPRDSDRIDLVSRSTNPGRLAVLPAYRKTST